MRCPPILTAALLLPFQLVAADELKIYAPEGGVKPETGKVNAKRVRLLDRQELYERNIPTEKLATLIKEVDVIQAVPDAPPLELLVAVRLTSTARPKFDLSSNGQVSKEVLQGSMMLLRRRLMFAPKQIG